jgi:AAA15 family ATPase/GTPase
MNYIDNIEIKNFKSIRHQKIEGCRRINVFIGYPNVGKSNLIEALSLFCITNETRFSDFIRVKEDPTLFFNGFINNTVEVTLNGLFQIFCKYSNGELQVVEKYLESYSDSKTVFRHPTLRENFFKNFGYNRSIAPQAAVPGFSIKKYEFKKNELRNINQYSGLKFPFGENLFDIIQTNEIINDEVSELLKEYGFEFLYESRLQAYTIFKRTDKGVFTIPYELLADTLQRVIFYKAAIFSNKETVLLFEEPEAHMFPPYISKFTADVMYDKNNNQYFIATHSPFVLNDFMEDVDKESLSIYAVGYSKGETTVSRLTDKQVNDVYQYGVDLFFNLEDFLKDVVS